MASLSESIINDVNVSALRNAINNCKSSINYTSTKNIISCLSNNSVWNASAKSTLNKSLEILTDKRYKELEKKLDTYLSVTSQIENYQSLSKRNKQLNNSLTDLNNRLYYIEQYTESYTTLTGKTVTSTKYRTVKNEAVANQIASTKNEIKNNENQMKSLANSIGNII